MNTLFPAICFLAFATLYFVSCAVDSDVQKYIDLQTKNCNNKTTEFADCKKNASFGYITKVVLTNCKSKQASTRDSPSLATLCKQLTKKQMDIAGMPMPMPIPMTGLNEAYFNCIKDEINKQTQNNATGAIENSRVIIEGCEQVQKSTSADDST